MKQLSSREKLLVIKSAGVSIGFFLIFLGLFRLLEINTNYLIFLLILVGTVLVIWDFILEKGK